MDPNARTNSSASLLYQMTKGGFVDVARLLPQSGADPQVQDDYGSTPLHVAAWNGQLGMVRLLLEGGVSPNVVNNKNGWTSLHAAARNGWLEIVKLLLEQGANVDATDFEGKTLLSQVLTYKYPLRKEDFDSVIELLGAYGAEEIGSESSESSSCMEVLD